MTRTLIDAIVRQTVVLIAQLATSRGLRAPLAHIAERVLSSGTLSKEANGCIATDNVLTQIYDVLSKL